MKHNKIRKDLTFLIVIFGFLSIGAIVMMACGGSVLNDLESALAEIEDLEKNGLLDNPPENISSTAKREIELVHNSSGLKQYIKKTKSTLHNITISFFAFITFIFISLLVRIYFSVIVFLRKK